MIPYGRHDITDEDIEAVAQVLGSEWLTTGPAVDAFERDLQAATDDTPVVCVSSGTAALHTAYAAAGITYGDEVITPPMTFVATQATAIQLGAKIVFADIHADTGNIDPSAVEAAITPRTAAIAAVDYAGHPADMDVLRRIADRYGLLLIEDAAHSLGSTYRGRAVGSLADLTTFSFFPTKNITTGEGGAVASSDAGLLRRAREFSHQGLVRDRTRQVRPDEGPWHQEVQEFGLNYRMPDILATLGSSQLRRLPANKVRRAALKATYDRAFAPFADELVIPIARPDVAPLWHLYPLRVPRDRRRAIYDHLRRRGVLAQVNYMPAYWHPAFDSDEYPIGLCPVAEEFYARELSLPLHTRLTNEDAAFVVTTVLEALNA